MSDLRSVAALAAAVRAAQADLDRLTLVRNQAVVEERRAGASLGELAAALGLTRSAVQAIMRQQQATGG